MLKRIACILICSSLLLLPANAASVATGAEAAVLMEQSGRETAFEFNARKRLPMASTTKIMTGLLAIESGRLDETVTITEEMVGVEGSSMYLRSSEKLTLRDLVYGLMLASANDAAQAIAIFLSGSVADFASAMNAKAEELQLNDTSFANPHGLDHRDHYTTAYDLALLAASALDNEVFKDIVGTSEYTVKATCSSEERRLFNHNKLLSSYEGAIGVKTGYTKKCGRCLVSAAERDGVILIAVTLNDPCDWADHKKMLDMGFEQFENCVIADVGSLRFQLPIIGGVKASVAVSNKDKLSLVLNKSKRKTMSCSVEAIGGCYRFAPVSAGVYLADAVFKDGTAEIARIPLYAEEGIELVYENKGIFDFIYK